MHEIKGRTVNINDIPQNGNYSRGKFLQTDTDTLRYLTYTIRWEFV